MNKLLNAFYLTQHLWFLENFNATYSIILLPEQHTILKIHLYQFSLPSGSCKIKVKKKNWEQQTDWHGWRLAGWLERGLDWCMNISELSLSIFISTGISGIEQALLSALIAEERRGEGKASWGGARHIETKDPPQTEMKPTGSEGLAGFCLSRWWLC